MNNFKVYNQASKPTNKEKEEVVQFLYKHLEEYGDEKEDILKCLNFAVKDSKNSLGGFVLVLKDNKHYTKKSIKKRKLIEKASYKQYLQDQENK